ncbi:MAG: DUF433 domain-containing protein [Saprospiraceae bacterium]|nr:DUF433 domain-containing protein [Saprospiraceae bacterium]
MSDFRNIITIEPGRRSGQPCIRGMRITVYDVLSYLAAGMSISEILDDFPKLTEADIIAVLAYAAEAEKTKLVVPQAVAALKS